MQSFYILKIRRKEYAIDNDRGKKKIDRDNRGFKALLPLLKTAASNAADKTGLSVKRAAIINMTSILGSIAENTDGGFYPYRCSKVRISVTTSVSANREYN